MLFGHASGAAGAGAEPLSEALEAFDWMVAIDADDGNDAIFVGTRTAACGAVGVEAADVEFDDGAAAAAAAGVDATGLSAVAEGAGV